MKSKKTKEDILNEYQQGCSAKYSKPVTTTFLGTPAALKPPSQFVSMKRSVMKPDPNKHYTSGPISFGNVLALIMNSFLSAKDMLSIALTCNFFARLFPKSKDSCSSTGGQFFDQGSIMNPKHTLILEGLTWRLPWLLDQVLIRAKLSEP